MATVDPGFVLQDDAGDDETAGNLTWALSDQRIIADTTEVAWDPQGAGGHSWDSPHRPSSQPARDPPRFMEHRRVPLQACMHCCREDGRVMRRGSIHSPVRRRGVDRTRGLRLTHGVRLTPTWDHTRHTAVGAACRPRPGALRHLHVRCGHYVDTSHSRDNVTEKDPFLPPVD